MIKNLIPRLAERGRIKIGEKGEMKTSAQGKQFAQPKKLDHIVITTMQRDAAGRLMPDTELMAQINPGGGKLVEIPIRLLYDDIDLNFFTRYACYKGNRCWCSGDGEDASRITGENGNYKPVPCPCERQDPMYQGTDKCKTLGTLSALIEGVNRVGGVWSFRTTSFNSVNAILSSMALIKAITGGPLSGIPLMLVLSPKTVTIPTTGKPMVVFVMSIEYRGPESELAELGYERARQRVEHKIRMDLIEESARRLLVAPHEEPTDAQVETAEEFYPEGVVVETPPPKPSQGKKKAAPAQSPAPAPEPQAATGMQAQDPGNGGDPEPQEATVKENLTVHPAITLPALMELAKKPDGMVDLPIGLVTTKGVPIGQWLDWGPDLGGEMTVTLELVDNLGEVAQGLSAAVIQKAFNEAGIIFKVVSPADAEQEGKERLTLADDLKAPESQETLANAEKVFNAPPQGGRSTAAPPKGNGGQARKSLF
jgi:hypothetical protein